MFRNALHHQNISTIKSIKYIELSTNMKRWRLNFRCSILQIIAIVSAVERRRVTQLLANTLIVVSSKCIYKYRKIVCSIVVFGFLLFINFPSESSEILHNEVHNLLLYVFICHKFVHFKSTWIFIGWRASQKQQTGKYVLANAGSRYVASILSHWSECWRQIARFVFIVNTNFYKKCDPCPSGSHCVPSIQCPAHVRMRAEAKPQICDLPHGTHGLCCSTGRNHTGRLLFLWIGWR